MRRSEDENGVDGSAGEETARIRAAFPGNAHAAFHAPRYVALLSLLAGLVDRSTARILDIGNSPFTQLAAERFALPVDNLGLDGEFPTPYGSSHWFDLNQAPDPARWRTDLGPYDVVVMAEVIEHLHTAPSSWWRPPHAGRARRRWSSRRPTRRSCPIGWSSSRVATPSS